MGEGVELAVLITRWRAAARAGRAHLRSTWFPTSLAAIREATLATNLSPARRLTVIHAFNNLLASKVLLTEHILQHTKSVFITYSFFMHVPSVFVNILQLTVLIILC